MDAAAANSPSKIEAAWKNPATLLWAVAISSAVALVVAAWRSKVKVPTGKRLPPGPRGLPLIGHLPFVTRALSYEKLMEWSKIYGPIFRINMGSKDVLILNDFDSIKDVITKNEILNRSENVIFQQAGIQGIANLNGDPWVDNRRFSLHVLRDLGFGKKSMEEHVKEESQYLADRLAATKGAPIFVQDYLIPSVSNNVTALVFGSRYSVDDPRRKFLDEKLARVLKAFAAGQFLTFMPSWVHKVAGWLPLLRSTGLKDTVADVIGFVKKEIQEHKDTLEEHSNRDFIDGYLKKIDENKGSASSNFTERFLIGNVGNFFGAGSNTVQISVQWHLLNCAHKPDSVQRSIQAEIDGVVGRERLPCWEDHKRMPFTVATIWEMYRWRSVARLSVPREAAQDTVYKEYFIPKGTVVMPHLEAVHMDPQHWEDPEQFKPTRFLKDGGLAPKPEQLIPFSIGRRMCPGETLATMEIFLFLTTLLQRFQVRPEEGRTIDIDSRTTGFSVPKQQRLRFVVRD